MAIPIAYRISTLGAQLCVNTRTDIVRLVLSTHTYYLQFMVLPGQGIDAILGMNWLRVYGVVLDLKQRVVELWLPSSEDRMSLLMPSDLALPVHAHVDTSPDLASISVVCEFSDVSLKIYLGCHRIGMWSSPLSWSLALLLSPSARTVWPRRNWLK